MAGDEMTKNWKISNAKSCGEIADPSHGLDIYQNNAENQNQHKKGLPPPFNAPTREGGDGGG
ncbi:MAG: hypothetical protein DRG66_04985 [Deltaproteobacteria bacterium]|nr:MAG: hypothetical protein DRG66_04985 [Deltaproteobacteria bacterium]